MEIKLKELEGKFYILHKIQIRISSGQDIKTWH